ncbi:MAG: hypothetical protein OEW87_13435, partial [Flavobacteriaceae bacterium]|nr:hypothetical protein [Flavobacteriaceae bacterium]
LLDILEAEEKKGKLENYIYEIYGLSDDIKKVITEFFEFRIKLSDGNVPSQAIRKVCANEITEYKNSLSDEIDRWFGRINSHNIRVHTFNENGIGVVVATYQSMDKNILSEGANISGTENLDEWVDKLISSEYSPLGNTCYVERNKDTLQIRMVKPLEYIHWTMERVVADGEIIINSVLDQSHVKEA